MQIKSLDPAETPAEMRDAIEKARYEEPIIHAALTCAYMRGYSPNDTNQALAYYAMQALIEMRRHMAKLLSLQAPPIMFVPVGFTVANPELKEMPPA